MNGIGMLSNELRLLSRSTFARLVVVLTAASAVLGMRAVEYANDMQFHGMGRTSLTMSLGAAQYGAMAGAALFAMLTLLVLSRDRRQQSRSIIEAAAGHGRVTAARVAALLTLGLVTTLVCLVAALVAHHYQTSASCEVLPYLFSLGLILLPAIWFATLVAAALDLVFENLDVSFLTFGTMYFFGFTTPNYLLRWVQTSASVYSDFGGIEPVGRLVVYNRLFWAVSRDRCGAGRLLVPTASRLHAPGLADTECGARPGACRRGCRDRTGGLGVRTRAAPVPG